MRRHDHGDERHSATKWGFCRVLHVALSRLRSPMTVVRQLAVIELDIVRAVPLTERVAVAVNQ
jgi:hypothetical protein